MKKYRKIEATRTIKLNSRNVPLVFDDKVGGGMYRLYGDGGSGEVRVGMQYDHLPQISVNLLHEIVEFILDDDDKCWRMEVNGSSEVQKQFVFDHHYLSQFIYKLQEAILSSGFFELKDGRPDATLDLSGIVPPTPDEE